MLNQLLELLRLGGTRRIEDLAQALDTTPRLVEVMLEDLARMGYVKRVGEDCVEMCAACPRSNQCVAGGGPVAPGMQEGRVWVLAEKEEETE